MNNNNEVMQAIWAVQANKKGRGTEETRQKIARLAQIGIIADSTNADTIYRKYEEEGRL